MAAMQVVDLTKCIANIHCRAAKFGIGIVRAFYANLRGERLDVVCSRFPASEPDQDAGHCRPRMETAKGRAVMIDQRIAGPRSARAPEQPPKQPQHETDPAELEKHQPDPLLQSRGRLGGGGMSLVALAIIALLAVVFYGLNGRNTTSSPVAGPPIASNAPAPGNQTPHG
jgi:hypothetical protein